jgi:uncharacterized phage protein (TIGR01671 family)
MKREIKFRAWDEGHKEMHYDFQFIKSGDESNDWIIFISDKQILKDGLEVHAHNPFFRQQFHIMQFTGLKDKNGKDIYEDDLVITDEAGWMGRVSYVRDSFMVGDNKGGFSYQCNWERFEVIGNIYENSELLSDSM